MSSPQSPNYKEVADGLAARSSSSLFKNLRIWWWRSSSESLPKFNRRDDPLTAHLADRHSRLNVLRQMYVKSEVSPDPFQRPDLSSEAGPARSMLAHPIPRQENQIDARNNETSARREEVERRAYRLAATDLFVETALDILRSKARIYKGIGIAAKILSVVSIAIGVLVAAISIPDTRDFVGKVIDLQPTTNPCAKEVELRPVDSHCFDAATFQSSVANLKIPPEVAAARLQFEQHAEWRSSLSKFLKSFTLYGFIVLTAVFLLRLGRAFLDQSERLQDKRHALRQGRLFVHLNDGKVDIKEMEKAFAWNLQQANAFASIPTEAKAPLGGAIADISRVWEDAVKVTADVVRNESNRSRPG